MNAGDIATTAQEAVEKADFLREFANQSVQSDFGNLLQIYEAGEI